jgi:protease-4
LSKSIWSVFQDKKDNYWFGSNGQGVYRYDGKALTQFTKKQGLPHDQIRGIQGDKSGNVYINTPGGSAFASDVIARAILQLRAIGKPVVVSMGDMAASGGYYIAAPADIVFAEPSTITGSIGIFTLKVNAAKLVGTLGINIETNNRGAHADYMSPYRPWTDAELKMVMDKMRYLYGQFIETVANGRASRGLTVARVDELGRGQVWTGALAQSVGLVDKMGGLADAMAANGKLNFVNERLIGRSVFIP